MKWIPENNPPDKDMLCIIACKRSDGSIYVPYYSGYYTTGLQRTPDAPIYTGFCNDGVIAWMPVPEKYTQNKKGWILTTEKWPTKKGNYIVTIYDKKNRECVRQAAFNPEREEFYGEPDVIAWMPIPKVMIA